MTGAANGMNKRTSRLFNYEGHENNLLELLLEVAVKDIYINN